MIKIRVTESKDLDFIFSCLENKSEDFLYQSGYGRFHAYPITKSQIKSVLETRKDTKYFIILNDSTLIGSVELDFFDWEKKECSVARFLIADEHRNMGLGAVALQTLTKLAFEEFDMNRVRLSVFDFNIGAIKCYQKAGYKENNRVTRPNGWLAIEMESLRATN